MKIRCESCGAKYSIADNLLKKTVTKFRCKKCGHVMSVQAPDGEGEDHDDLANLPDAPSSAIDFPEESTQIGQVSSHGWTSANAQEHAYNGGYDENMTAAQAYEEAADASYGDPAAQDYYAQQAGADAAGFQDYESAAGAYPEDDMYGATGLFSAENADWQSVIQESQAAQEEDLYAGMDTNVSRAGHEENYSESDEAVDDEFDRALQEREEELMPRKPIRQDYSDIAPNHQEQGIVPLSMARQEIQEAGREEVSTKVFNINALETLRSEREAARKDRDQRTKGKQVDRKKAPAPVGVAETKEPPEWYVIENDEQVGPLSKAEIRERLKRGSLDAEHYIWKEGLPEWKPILEVAALADVLKQLEDEKAGRANGLSLASSIPAPSSGNLGAISFAPPGAKPISTIAEPPKVNDLRSLAGGIAETKPSTPKRPTSMAAALLQEEPPPPIAPSGGFGVLGPAVPDIAAPVGSMTGGFQGFGTPQPTGAFASSPVGFAGPTPAPFTGSPFDKEKKSNLGLIVGLSIGGTLVLGLAIFLGLYFAMSGPKNDPNTLSQLQPGVNQPLPSQPVPSLPVQQPPPPPVVGTSAPLAQNTPTAPTSPRPEARTEPEKRAEPEERTEPVARRKTRRYARRRARSARRRAAPEPRDEPAARRTGGDDPPPPPPPPPTGDDPPPPPPPTGGGKTGLSSDLGNLLGGGNEPVVRRTAPAPRRSSVPEQLTKSQVARVIQNNAEQISGCQDRYGKGTKSIRVSWTIKPSGMPTGISVDGASGSFANCVKGKIRNWRFPRFSGSPMEIGGVPFQF